MLKWTQEAKVISAYRVARNLGKKIKASAYLSISVILSCILKTTNSSPKAFTLGFL